MVIHSEGSVDGNARSEDNSQQKSGVGIDAPFHAAKHMASAKNDTQPRQGYVYRKYSYLESVASQRFHGSLAGNLIVSAGFGRQGSELALASTIADAAYLGIDPNPQQLKAAVRNGTCDFMVNTLEEALRVLKNEIRKRKPVSVGLLGFACDVLAAMVERGVQPDLLSETSPIDDWERYRIAPTQMQSMMFDVENTITGHRRELRQLVERGAVALDADEMDEKKDELEITWTAANLQDLQRMDRIATELLPTNDTLRSRWLQRASGAFYRQRPLQRVMGVRQQELAQILRAFEHAKGSAPFATSASVTWQNGDGKLNAIAL